jgi:hypothetical protein
MREEEYHRRIDWLWTRAEEFQKFSKSIHHHGTRAAMARNAACELEDVLERKLLHERGMRGRPGLRAVASRGERVGG